MAQNSNPLKNVIHIQNPWLV